MSSIFSESVKVLLVEKEQNDYILIRNLLSRTRGAKFELQWVQDLEEAGPVMAGVEYDACLLEERLGEKGGLDLVRQTLLVRSNAPLIMLTARDEYQPDVDAMRAGVMDYLVKSQLSAELLERAIRYAIDRKRIETVLHRTSAEYSCLTAAIENLSVGVLITDPRQPDNPLVFVNPAFTVITGYPSEEALGRNPRFLKHPDSDPDVLQAIREAIREQRLFKGVVINRRKDGRLYRNALIISPCFNEQGKLMSFVGLSEDVTAKYQAEEALQQSHKRFEGTVANVPGMIYRALCRADGTLEFLYVSEGCRELFGIAPEQFQCDLLGLRRMVHPDDRESFDSAVVLSGERPWRWLGRLMLASGEEKYVHGAAQPDLQENGDVIWDGLLMDVTQRVQAEQEMAQLAAIVESSNDAIYGKTMDGTVTSWNAAAEMMYGYTAAEMIGQPIARLLPRNRRNEVHDVLRRIRRGERVQSYETTRCSKDGVLLDIALTVSPIKDREGRVTGASGIARDISQQKEAAAHIKRQVLRIQALRDIDMAISGSLDLRVTLNVLLDQVTTHLHVDSAAVLLLNPHTHCLDYAAGRGFRTTALQRTHLRIGEGFAGRAALERRLMIIPDLLHDESGFKRGSLLIGEDFVSYCATPLITKGRVEGILEIFHRAPLHTDSDWLSFLETLAGQAAIAIENAELFNDLQRSNVELHVAYDSTLEGWSRALDLRDKETEGHSQRVTAGTLTLAHVMNISDQDLVHIRRGALLHDIGKMGIPDSILLKPGALTEDEWIVMKKHPVYAYELLSPIEFLRPALDIPYCHHEKWDGSGYPRGLKGEQIPIGARIFAVVDVWDALSSERPYRAAWPAAKVRDHIAQGSGNHFDPRVLEIFLDTEM
jgi:PAS domain S-box-containing protein